jgi:MFS family permease
MKLGSASPAFSFVLIMGLVNLFGDVAYEGGASINGPFMASLGAGAAIISITAGAGEFLGYALRLPAGYIADKTGRYWTITFIGYVINLFAVPAMALAGNWQVAALLVLAERAGRALRKPTVEAMLSYTTNELGRGWVYGVNTALDEIGATIGPLIIALVLLLHGNYRTGYALLAISALLALASLIAARVTFPLPARLEQGHSATARGFQRAYWMAMLAGAFFAAGLMSFELISYHLAANKIIEGPWIPVLLALATAFGVIASLVLGKLYDGYGMPVLLAAVLLSAMFSPLVFFGGTAAVVAGMLLWGIGYATQDTLLKAVIAGLLPEGKRNTAFGLFYAGYGGGWLVGSIVTGLLYDQSRVGLVVFAAAAQLASLPLFLLAERRRR